MANSEKLGITRHASRIAFIQSRWHQNIVDQCKESFLKEFSKLSSYKVDLYEVPGAYEIPLQAKLLAKSGKYSAIVGAGLVVNGGIYQHEFVAQAVIMGLMQVQLETEIPVFTAVLTPLNFHESDDHYQFFSQHFIKKGKEAANACHEILLMQQEQAHTLVS